MNGLSGCFASSDIYFNATTTLIKVVVAKQKIEFPVLGACFVINSQLRVVDRIFRDSINNRCGSISRSVASVVLPVDPVGVPT